jgi:hypothetical protein
MSRIALSIAVGTILMFFPVVGEAQWADGTHIYNTNPGNVGVGTTTPLDKLHVNGNIRIAPNGILNSQNTLKIRDVLNGRAVMQFIPTGTLETNPANFEFYGTDYVADPVNYERLMIRSRGTSELAYTIITGAGGTGAIRPLRISTGANTGVFIDSGGRVGIGTTAPTQQLEVNGNIFVSGNINAKYQDVAEWVPTDGEIPSGTVVILDPQHSNRVMPSSTSYDTSVAGVISSQPGIALGEPSDTKVLVATMGRVRVKVDASSRPIRIGDLLVTSDKPGIAMRSEPLDIGGHKIHRPGTVVGKALEPLGTGSGEILVLLSLQ